MLNTGATWNSRATAKAAGISHDKLQLWLKRKHPVGDGISGGGAQGVPRVFTFRGVMEIAYARAFVDQGMRPKEAFRAAAKVAYTTSRRSNGKGLDVVREAGFPFPPNKDGTLALAFDGRTEVVMTGEAILHGAFKSNVEAMTVVNIGRVFRDVCERMGFDADQVLREVYAGAPRRIENEHSALASED